MRQATMRPKLALIRHVLLILTASAGCATPDAPLPNNEELAGLIYLPITFPYNFQECGFEVIEPSSMSEADYAKWSQVKPFKFGESPPPGSPAD